MVLLCSQRGESGNLHTDYGHETPAQDQPQTIAASGQEDNRYFTGMIPIALERAVRSYWLFVNRYLILLTN